MNSRQSMNSRAVIQGWKACDEENWEKARDIFREEVRNNRTNTMALLGFGLSLLALNHPYRAIIILHRAAMIDDNESLDISPSLHYALCKGAELALQTNRFKIAIDCCKNAILMKDGDVHTLSNYSIALLRSNNINEAMKYSKLAVEADPENSKAVNNHGTTLHEAGRFTEAGEFYRKALDTDPKHPNAIKNLGTLAQSIGNLDEAIDHYQIHLKNYPEDHDCWVMLAGVLLSKRQWQSGWEAYEKRINPQQRIMDIPYEVKLLKRISKKTAKILVICEQGFGDTFQFIRYLPKIQQISSSVTLQGPDKLSKLIKLSGLCKNYISTEDILRKNKAWHKHNFDSWIPLMSIPQIVGIEPDKVKNEKRYLKSSKLSDQKWQKILRVNNKANIGLHWQGNPQHEFTLSRGRSLPLMLFKNVLSIRNANFVSFQKGEGSEQISENNFESYFHQSQKLVNSCWCFAETASMLMNCDLIITSDSGLAHLSAALGRPTWILLPYVSEWRWGFDTEKTFWYPSVKLFRQASHGNWKDLINNHVHHELQAWLIDYESSKNHSNNFYDP